MILQTFITTAHSPWKILNKMHTYVSLQYNTETKELKLVDEFEGKKYEYSIGTATLVEDTTSGVVTDDSTNTNTGDNTGDTGDDTTGGGDDNSTTGNDDNNNTNTDEPGDEPGNNDNPTSGDNPDEPVAP